MKRAGTVQRKLSPGISVGPPPPLATGAALHWQQLAALFRKNLTIRRALLP